MKVSIDIDRFFSDAYRTLTLGERIALKSEIARLRLTNCIMKHVVWNGWLNGCSTYYAMPSDVGLPVPNGTI